MTVVKPQVKPVGEFSTSTGTSEIQCLVIARAVIGRYIR